MESLLLTFLVPLLTGILVLVLRPMVERNLKLLLAFSASFLLSVCFIQLLPEVFHNGSQGGYFILAGFFIQILLDFFSEGIEHGHIHNSVNKKFPFAIFISLCLHAFIESFPLAGVVDEHIHHHAVESPAHATFIGVLLHKIPISIVLTVLLLGRGLSKVAVLTALFVFSLSAPLGMVLVHYSLHAFSWIDMNYLTALAIGIFLHISTVILFESSHNHKFNSAKFISILLGIVLALLTLGSHQ
jgi:zinc transporter ZupT